MASPGWLVVFAALAACGDHDIEHTLDRAPVRERAVVTALPVPPPFDVAPPADAVIALARGDRHACVVRASGAVDCWGEHRSACHECLLPVPADPHVWRVPGLTDAVAVTSDARCFLRRTGEAACLASDRREVVAVAGVTGARAIASDSEAVCALLDHGRVQCRDVDGKRYLVDGVTDAIAVASASMQSCALRANGRVACGFTGEHERWISEPGLEHVEELAIGGSLETYACARVRGGAVHCVDIAMPAPAAAEERLADPAPFAGATQLSVWVADNQPVLEGVVGGKVVRAVRFEDAEVVPVLADVKLHARGCAVRATGAVACWGTNAGGVLAQPTTLDMDHVPPRVVVGLGNVVSLALATTESWALTRDGRVLRWGRSDEGNTAIPVELPLGLGPENLVGLAALPDGQVCMLGATGLVWCQVESDVGGGRRIEQLDTDDVVTMTPEYHALVVAHADGSSERHSLDRWRRPLSVEEVSAPGGAKLEPEGGACAWLSAHGIACGDGSGAPAPAAGNVSANDYRCELARGGARCWPVDEFGKRTHEPRAVPGLHDATALVAGPTHACALARGGQVACWHFDKDGAPGEAEVVLTGGAREVVLGTGSEGQLRESRYVNDGPAPGGERGCAIMDDRTVRCWGMHLFGELGDGSLGESETPIGIAL